MMNPQQPARFAVQLTASIPHDAGVEASDVNDFLDEVEIRLQADFDAEVSISFARSTKGAGPEDDSDEEGPRVVELAGYR